MLPTNSPSYKGTGQGVQSTVSHDPDCPRVAGDALVLGPGKTVTPGPPLAPPDAQIALTTNLGYVT